MNNPLISVITTTKNNADNIDETLTSIKQQTAHNWELVVKDKNSTDGTVDILKRTPEIAYWESTDDKNIYDGLNVAAKHCTGEWVIVIQSGDTLFSSDIFEKMEKVLLTTDADIVYGAVLDSSQTPPKRYPAKPISFLPYGIIGSHQGMFIRKKLLDQFPYDTNYRIGADYDFLWKCFRSRAGFLRVDDNIAYVDGQGLSTKNLSEGHLEKERIARKYSRAVLPYMYRLSKRIRIAVQLKKRLATLLAIVRK